MTDEEEALAELKQMMPEELLKVEHAPKYWNCCIRMCKRYTTVLDFGISPYFYWKQEGFRDMRDRIFYCAHHWKLHKAGKITERHRKPMYSGLRMILDEKPKRIKK